MQAGSMGAGTPLHPTVWWDLPGSTELPAEGTPQDPTRPSAPSPSLHRLSLTAWVLLQKLILHVLLPVLVQRARLLMSPGPPQGRDKAGQWQHDGHAVTPAGHPHEVSESPKVSWEAGTTLPPGFHTLPPKARQGKAGPCWLGTAWERWEGDAVITHSFWVSGDLHSTGGYCHSLSLCCYPVTTTGGGRPKKRGLGEITSALVYLRS